MADEKHPIANVASLGGIARKNSMTKEERSASARRAVEARWIKHGKAPIPKATHEGVIESFGLDGVACAVLDNGKRILTQGGFLTTLGRSRSPKAGTGVLSTVDGTPFFLQAEILKPFIDNDLLASTAPIIYDDLLGNKAIGYDGEALPMVAEVYLKLRDSCAREGKPVPKQYQHIVMACDLIVRGLARVAIRALIDEATGFQYVRPRRDLEEYLKTFLAESLRQWVRTFPSDYFKHLCRLRKVELREDMKLPQYFGMLTNNLIYRRIAPGLLKRLKDRRAERGTPSNKLHSWLSEDVGLRGVLVHLGTVVGLMKINTDYATFEKQLNQIAPLYPADPGLFDNPSDWEEPAH